MTRYTPGELVVYRESRDRRDVKKYLAEVVRDVKSSVRIRFDNRETTVRKDSVSLYAKEPS